MALKTGEGRTDGPIFNFRSFQICSGIESSAAIRYACNCIAVPAIKQQNKTHSQHNHPQLTDQRLLRSVDARTSNELSISVTVWCWDEGSASYLFWEHSDIFSKWLWATHISPGHARVSRRACRQLALLEDKGKEGEQGMPETRNRLLSRYRHERSLMAKLVTSELRPRGDREGVSSTDTLPNIFQDVDFHDKNFTVEQVL